MIFTQQIDTFHKRKQVKHLQWLWCNSWLHLQIFAMKISDCPDPSVQRRSDLLSPHTCVCSFHKLIVDVFELFVRCRCTMGKFYYFFFSLKTFTATQTVLLFFFFFWQFTFHAIHTECMCTRFVDLLLLLLCFLSMPFKICCVFFFLRNVVRFFVM